MDCQSFLMVLRLISQWLNDLLLRADLPFPFLIICYVAQMKTKETSFKMELEIPEGGALMHPPLLAACTIGREKEDLN